MQITLKNLCWRQLCSKLEQGQQRPAMPHDVRQLARSAPQTLRCCHEQIATGGLVQRQDKVKDHGPTASTLTKTRSYYAQSYVVFKHQKSDSSLLGGSGGELNRGHYNMRTYGTVTLASNPHHTLHPAQLYENHEKAGREGILLLQHVKRTGLA